MPGEPGSQPKGLAEKGERGIPGAKGDTGMDCRLVVLKGRTPPDQQGDNGDKGDTGMKGSTGIPGIQGEPV